MMKKVLIIAYHFPPSASIGQIRPLKFAKYLNKFGWQPVVLTPKNEFYFGRRADETLFKELPESVRVVRTFSFEPLNEFWKLRNRNTESKNEDYAKFTKIISSNKSIVNRLKSSFLDIMSTPDRYLGWMPFAVYRALALLRDDTIKAIYTTSSPVTCHLIGYVLKRITKRSWIADFRDPWTQNFGFTRVFKFQLRFEEFLERLIFNYADKIISVSEPIVDKFRLKYPHINRGKFKAIPNGFDSEDFHNKIPEPFEKFTITYTGAVYGHENAHCFFEAIESLITEKEELNENLQILFVGSIHPTKRTQHFDRLNQSRIIQLIGRTNHGTALQYMLNSHVLLLLVGKYHEVVKGCYTTKIFEYLCAKKPILALVPDGVAADLIRQAGAGTVVDPEDMVGIKNAILSLYQKYKEGELTVDSDSALISKFDRRELAKELAAVLNDAVN